MTGYEISYFDKEQGKQVTCDITEAPWYYAKDHFSRLPGSQMVVLKLLLDKPKAAPKTTRKKK